MHKIERQIMIVIVIITVKYRTIYMKLLSVGEKSRIKYCLLRLNTNSANVVLF